MFSCGFYFATRSNLSRFAAKCHSSGGLAILKTGNRFRSSSLLRIFFFLLKCFPNAPRPARRLAAECRLGRLSRKQSRWWGPRAEKLTNDPFTYVTRRQPPNTRQRHRLLRSTRYVLTVVHCKEGKLAEKGSALKLRTHCLNKR